MKKITFCVFLFLLNIVTYGQFSVSIPNMTVNGGLASSINFGANVSSLNVTLSVDITTTLNQNDSSPVGDLTVYYKRNSGAPAVIPSGGSTTTVLFLGSNKITKPINNITLNASQFDATGGVLYVEYRSSSSASFVSSNISITKTVSPTNPTNPTDPTNPTNPTNPTPSNNTITGTQTINEGSIAALLIGSEIPPSENYTYTYEWRMKKSDGNYYPIPDGMYKDYFAGQLLTTTTFVRKVIFSYRNGVSGTYSTYSDPITVTVIPAPPIQNNTINLIGTYVTGTFPTGGLGSYNYKWIAYVVDGEDPWIIEQNTDTFTIPANMYEFAPYNTVLVARIVTSGSRTSTSNFVRIYSAQEIGNNSITISGRNIVGSLPTGGGEGGFYYQYIAYNEIDGEVIGDPQILSNEQSYYFPYDTPLITKIYRKVYSGDKVSISNTIVIPPTASGFGKKTTETVAPDLTVYPNPTSESINFATNFSTDKNIEIVLYSEKLGNEKSVYKGKVTPNQVINWSIPANYQKGLYFYKILSENKEVKSGKVLFN